MKGLVLKWKATLQPDRAIIWAMAWRGRGVANLQQVSMNDPSHLAVSSEPGYRGSMPRVVLLIAVLFGFVAFSVSGSWLASVPAHAGAPVVVAAVEGDICLDAPEAPLRAVSFKPCSKKINGKAVECHRCPMVVPVAVGFVLPELAHSLEVVERHLVSRAVFESQFRPPRALV
jgi:hypothetical protein